MPHWCKTSRAYLVPVQNYWAWTKTTPQKRGFSGQILMPKRKIVLFLEMWVTKKIFTRAVANFFFFFFNFIEFFKYSVHLTTLTAVFFVGKKRVLPYCSKGKKRQFVRIHLLVENHPKGEFYWLSVFHYGLKIQSLTWTLH